MNQEFFVNFYVRFIFQNIYATVYSHLNFFFKTETSLVLQNAIDKVPGERIKKMEKDFGDQQEPVQQNLE